MNVELCSNFFSFKSWIFLHCDLVLTFLQCGAPLNSSIFWIFLQLLDIFSTFEYFFNFWIFSQLLDIFSCLPASSPFTDFTIFSPTYLGWTLHSSVSLYFLFVVFDPSDNEQTVIFLLEVCISEISFLATEANNSSHRIKFSGCHPSKYIIFLKKSISYSQSYFILLSEKGITL